VDAAPTQSEGWASRLLHAAAALGLTPGLPEAGVAGVTLAAISARGQDARIARSEIAGLRMLLREAYPAVLLPSASSPAD
jgi:hypothetical protein